MKLVKYFLWTLISFSVFFKLTPPATTVKSNFLSSFSPKFFPNSSLHSFSLLFCLSLYYIGHFSIYLNSVPQSGGWESDCHLQTCALHGRHPRQDWLRRSPLYSNVLHYAHVVGPGLGRGKQGAWMATFKEALNLRVSQVPTVYLSGSTSLNFEP